MKLDFVEMSGFRGFRERTRIDFAPGFVVLCGRNGVGKSTVLDAIDFAVTGTINKFDFKIPRGGGLGDHIWWVGAGNPEDHYVSVGFVDKDGKRLQVTRRRDSATGEAVTELAERLCGGHGAAHVSLETLMRTTLIRDETLVSLSVDLSEQARFTAVRDAIGGLIGPDHSERTGIILKAAGAVRDQQKARLEAAQSDLGRTLTSLTEARSVAERSSDLSAALKTIDTLSIQLPEDPGIRTETVRNFIVERKAALQEIERARLLSEQAATEVAKLNSEEGRKELEDARTMVTAAVKEAERTAAMLALAERADQAERESDAYAAHLSAIVEHGETLGLQENHCPLCDAVRSEEEFAVAIAQARTRLAARGERLASAATTLANAQAASQKAKQALVVAQQSLSVKEQQREALEKTLREIRAIYEKHSFQATETDPSAAQLVLFAEQEKLTRLERAVLTLEASGAIDRISLLEARVIALRERVDQESAKLLNCEKVVDTTRQIDATAKSVANEMLTEQFDTVMPLLKELYRRLRPHGEWADIDADFGGKVRGSLNFTVGEGHNVQFLFSSGQRRAAGLAFLLAIHMSRRWCRWQSLLLDDPVQHIDDYRALNLVEVLSAIRRSGRQVVVAVEDPALADVLCRRLRSSEGEFGRRFDLHVSKDGSAEVARVQNILPMPREVLRSA